MASLLLAMQAAAQNARNADSLGLNAINNVLRIMPPPLSIDMTKGELNSRAPQIMVSGFGVMHKIWGVEKGRIGLSFAFLFAADSGTLLSRAISARAPLVGFELRDRTDSVDTLLVRTPVYRSAIEQLGPPDFCNRDTLVRDAVTSIVMQSFGGWRRGDADVTFHLSFDLRDEPSPVRQFSPRFEAMFRVTRSTDKLMRDALPKRHDSPCFFTDDEIREHAAVMDSTTYKLYRAELLKRPERPFTPP
jgi:hypothetical protein